MATRTEIIIIYLAFNKSQLVLDNNIIVIKRLETPNKTMFLTLTYLQQILYLDR